MSEGSSQQETQTATSDTSEDASSQTSPARPSPETPKIPPAAGCCGFLGRSFCFLFTFILIPLGSLYAAYGLLDGDFIVLEIPTFPTTTSRLVYTLRCHAISVIPIAIGFLAEIMVKLCSPSKEAYLEKLQSFLRNSLEQFFLLFTNTIALCTYLEQECMKLIPIVICLWVLGRFMDWWFSCRSCPNSRSCPPSCLYNISVFFNLLIFGINLYFVYEKGLGHGLDSVASTSYLF